MCENWLWKAPNAITALWPQRRQGTNAGLYWQTGEEEGEERVPSSPRNERFHGAFHTKEALTWLSLSPVG